MAGGVEMNKLTGEALLGHVDRRLYDVKGFVDYRKLKERLHIKVKTLAAAIHRTPRALEKNPRSENMQKGLRKIVHIISLLKEMLDMINFFNEEVDQLAEKYKKR